MTGRPEPGDGLIRLTAWLTVLLAVTSLLAAVFPNQFVPVSVPVALILFVLGSGAIAWGYALAIGRSRRERISLGGLFLLAEGVAPARVRRAFYGLLAIQLAVTLATAGARPFTPLAFGVLGPTSAYGLMVLWCGRHGTFPPKPEPSGRSPSPLR